MKNLSRVSLILLPALVMTIILFKINNTKITSVYADGNSKEKHIPFFEFQTTKGVRYTLGDVKFNSVIVIIHFNSECEYCDEKAQQIRKYLYEFENSELLFVRVTHISHN